MKLMLLLCVLIPVLACTKPTTENSRHNSTDTFFTKGADISWLTESALSP